MLIKHSDECKLSFADDGLLRLIFTSEDEGHRHHIFRCTESRLLIFINMAQISSTYNDIGYATDRTMEIINDTFRNSLSGVDFLEKHIEGGLS